MLTRVAGSAGLAGLGIWRGMAVQASSAAAAGAKGSGTNDRPLSGDDAVRQARRQQPSSVFEPPLLHDSLSELDYSYSNSRRGTALGPRMSSISDPQDYYLQNSMSEGSYGMPSALQRNGRRAGQGFASAGPSTRPTIQRIVVVNRSAAQDRPERLHDSFGHVDYSDANSK